MLPSHGAPGPPMELCALLELAAAFPYAVSSCDQLVREPRMRRVHMIFT